MKSLYCVSYTDLHQLLLVVTEVLTMFGCQLSALIHFSMHHQKSASDSPFQAKIGYPPSARAAATSFWRQRITFSKCLTVKTLSQNKYSPCESI